MVVVSLSDCPPKLRGDLSLWLMEITTGVFVGNVNARVREALWSRICEHVKTGRAAMVFSTNGEQGMDFYVHNTAWVPRDFEGLTLIRRPREGGPALPSGYSNAAKRKLAQRVSQRLRREGSVYVVFDLETTGLQPERDEILEIAALLVRDGEVEEEYTALVTQNTPLPPNVAALTGITEEELREKGVPLEEALAGFLDFAGEAPLVAHNYPFDAEFLRRACKRQGKPLMKNRATDTLALARRLVDDIEDYRLPTLAHHFGLPPAQSHRALPDCYTAQAIYENLKEQ